MTGWVSARNVLIVCVIACVGLAATSGANAQECRDRGGDWAIVTCDMPGGESVGLRELDPEAGRKINEGYVIMGVIGLLMLRSTRIYTGIAVGGVVAVSLIVGGLAKVAQ